MSKNPASRELPKHLGPLRGPAIVDQFVLSRPLRDLIIYELEDPDRAYRRHLASGASSDTQHGSDPCSAEENASRLFEPWLDARRVAAMYVHCDVTEINCSNFSRSDPWTKRWLN